MDAKRLQEIRQLETGYQEEIDKLVSQWDRDKLDAMETDLAHTVVDLLAYIDALKADMEEIRKAAHQLTLMPSVKVAAAIYHIAAQHADEPEV